MAPDFNQRVRQIFDQALDRPETLRLSFVKSACGADVSLYDAVDRLLRARAASQSFLDATVDHTGQIGRYLIRGELGRGAMGIVYDAVDPMIGRRVAVKVISLKAGMDPAEAEFMKERLFREARSAGRLIHPGIVLIFDVGLHDDSAFITMELVDGPSLHQLLAEGPLDFKTALGILQQTAAALDFAHQNGVVHRDIKPANIMLQNKVTVKVADFGIAKLMSQNATLTGALMGTPSYMSPEQIEAQPVDGRCDQFSLAVLAYELLTGARPFQADSMATVAHLIVYGPRPSARAANPSVPSGVDQVLERALSRFPADRFPNCTEFIAALEKALLHSALPPAPVPQKRPRLIYLGALAALLVVALALAAVRYKNPWRARPVAAPPAPAVVHAAAPAKPTPVAATQTSPPPEPPPPASPQPEKTALVVPRPAEAKPDPNAKAPAAFRAQEFYNAAMTKRHEGKPDEAAALLRQAADLGSASAMKELGEIYTNGEGVPKDDLTAMQWFLHAEAAGNSDAMLSLAGMYLLGNDAVPQSDEDAAKWFQKAADLKNPAGVYDLAKMYEEGQGVTRDMEKARQLYRQAAALGNVLAQRRLAEMEPAK
ncbi:MAG: serine/threonine-protein kinase [Bryobacteraceae bacterium]